MTSIDGTALDSLRSNVRGPVVTPGDADYDKSRTIYNAMIDRRPAAIAQCVDVADVRTTLAFAQDAGLDLAVRGGGHSGPGLCLVDDGLTLDLSPMRSVRVDPEARTAQVGGEASWATWTMRRTPSVSVYRPGSCRPPAWAASRSAAGTAT